MESEGRQYSESNLLKLGIWGKSAYQIVKYTFVYRRTFVRTCFFYKKGEADLYSERLFFELRIIQRKIRGKRRREEALSFKLDGGEGRREGKSDCAAFFGGGGCRGGGGGGGGGGGAGGASSLRIRGNGGRRRQKKKGGGDGILLKIRNANISSSLFPPAVVRESAVG